MFDTLFRGATLVSEQTGVLPGDIAVKDGRIAAIVTPGTIMEAAQTFDVSGLHLFPGVIDAHVHIGHGAPHAEDFFSESRSAAVGGVTTFLTYFRKEPYDYERLLPLLIEDGSQKSLIDFGVHLVLFTEDHLRSLPQFVAAGVTSFKFFLGHQEASHLPINDAFILDGFKALAQIPGTLAVAHCENAEINQAARQRAMAAGLTGLQGWSASRPDFSETEGIRRACYWAELAQVPLYVVHVGSARSAREVARQRQSSTATIYAETLVQYLTLTADSRVGVLAKMNPPLRTAEDRGRLWEAVAQGQFDTIASDHGAFMRSDKGDAWTGRTGTPSSGLILAGLLDGGYRTGRLALVDIARLTSGAPARVFGLGGRKGALRPGADADFALVDLQLTREVTPELMQSRSDFSPFEGLRLTGWPRLTVSRGEVVVEDGNLLGARGRGQYLPRTLAATNG